MAEQVTVRPMADSDQAWAHALIANHWGGMTMVSRGVLYDMRKFPGLVAWLDGERAGLLTYRIDGAVCEVMSLNSVVSGVGAGSALLRAVEDVARAAGCERVFLLTTNDNLHALRFYQRQGYRLADLRPGAIDEARRLKPSIPEIGMDGIPLRDELELERTLAQGGRLNRS
ncbi:MAG: GNAT family N-acetyltransferase [Chloroflexi bacterium]|nr:GNAT family N-acetyltransferase [Chloroflexota bacterium]